jgi:hypothetical protein
MLASSLKNVPELKAPNSAKKEKKGWMHGERAEFECVMEHHLRNFSKIADFKQELWAKF